MAGLDIGFGMIASRVLKVQRCRGVCQKKFCYLVGIRSGR
jgi:hypothetical protein